MDEVRGIICCLREDQMLEGGLKKKQQKEAKASELQTTSQSDVTRQAGWLFLFDIKHILLVIFLFRLSPGQEKS